MFLRLALLLLSLAGVLYAHDPGLSTARFEVGPTEVRLVTAMSPVDADLLLAPEQRRMEFAEKKGALEKLAPGLYRLALDEAPLTGMSSTVTLVAGDNIEFHYVFQRPAGVRLVIKPQLFTMLPPGHRQYTTVVDDQGALLAEKLLHVREADIALTLPSSLAAPAVSAASGSPAPSPGISSTSESKASFVAFLKLGVEHILTGYDHLLFLFGLLVVCSRWRLIFAIITSFTIGHSLTLILATLDFVTLAPRVIEPAIAASIVFVGVENLLRRGEEPRGRWLLTFFFGLVHGFGFAGVLRELGVGEMGGGLLVPLFSFNLGVEVGQVAVAGIALPILWWARRNPWFLRVGVPALSAVVGLAGLYWLLERTVFS